MTQSPPPVAIVGIGCRFPGGANDTDSFWTLLVEGRSGVREVPADRWNVTRFYHPDPAAIAAMATKWGGFVDNVDAFDARFWGLSPREAVRMDPQQRWLLELAWEAIEDAGAAPRGLRGRRIGVFVGISGIDYGAVQLPNLEGIDAYTNSGFTLSIAANRISYMLDLKGPSAAVDTACSSSLVAVWMACQNIWSGECEGALVGGVNALIAPQPTLGFSKASMLSPDGRCFAFDARANGYVRAEGAGVVYLKPLGAALQDRDRVYAVIRGVAVNQDGHTSSMTVPSAEAQTAMLREAYRHAGIPPASVVYVEAHGTGTPVGDPIEATALGRVLGEGRTDGSRCLIGSVKTNIGHLEAGAGIAGLIKAALVLHERAIPPTLNHVEPSPHIPFERLGLEVVTRLRALPSPGDRLPVAGVNAFGFGGTNAHVVLEGAPASTPPPVPAEPRSDRPCVLTLSARDEPALRAYAERYRDLLARTSSSLRDVCAFAGARKEHHRHRLAVIGTTMEELERRLTAWAADGVAAGVVSGRATAATAPVFVFTGQGAQWWAMGQQLLRREPLFSRTIDEIDARFQRLAGWSLRAMMTRQQSHTDIERTDVAQPAIFALQVALVALWKSWGVEPGKVIGHSVGEVTAAYTAGVYSLDDAVTLIFHRSRLMHRTWKSGRMAAVALSADDAAQAIRDEKNAVEIAGLNSPHLVTLAGDGDALARVVGRLERAGIFARWVRVEYAFHSRHMDPIRGELLEALREIRPRPWTVPFVSTVTGAPLAGPRLTAEYWWENIRRPVMFGPAVSDLVRGNDHTYLEIGPHPALESALKECLAEHGRAGGVFHSLRRETDDTDEMLTNLGGLYVLGGSADWRAVNQGGEEFVRLPAYPWNRESFWLESKPATQMRLAPPEHPLLGLRVPGALPTWQLTLDLRRLTYLEDHRIWNGVVFPAAGYAEIGLALGRRLFPHEAHGVEDLSITKALFLDPAAPPVVQVVFTPDRKGFAVYSSTDGSETWTLHAEGTLVRTAADAPGRIDVEKIRWRLREHFGHEQYCEALTSRGYQFGPSFKAVRNVWRVTGEALAEIEAPPSVAAAASDYAIHPALLDACFQAFMGTRVTATDARPEDELFLPQALRRIQLYGEGTPDRVWAHARITADEGSALTADVHVYDDSGARVADVLGFQLSRVEPTPPAQGSDDGYYRFEWEPRRLRGSGVTGTCAFAASRDIVAAVEAAAPEIAQRHAVDEYQDRYVPAARAAAAQLIQAAFMKLGWKPVVGARVQLPTFIETLGIAAEHQRVTRALLRDLAKHGDLCAIADDTWEVARVPARVDVMGTLGALRARHPRRAAEVDVLQRVGSRLAAVLAGDADPMASIFSQGSADLLERYYAEALDYAPNLDLLRVAVARAWQTLPPRRALRVLEVGAGTGSVTRVLLPELPANRTDYLFTDVGPAFLTAARKRFAGSPFVEYQTFDLEQDPQGQGIPPASFDLIVASDILHATADVRQALSHLRTCLADDGRLMFLEVVSHDVGRLNVVFGLLKGWWRFRDTDLRTDSALLERGQWETVLAECGFRDVASTSYSPYAEHALIMGAAAPSPARATREDATPSERRTYVVFADEAGTGEQLASGLSAGGHRAIVLRHGASFEQERPGSFRVVPGSDDDIRRALTSEALAPTDVAGVVHCWSLDHPHADDLGLEALRQAQHIGTLSALPVLRIFASTSTRVWFVTRHAHRVSDTDRVDGLASGPLIGVARVANSEQGRRVSLVDLDACSPVDAAAHLSDEVMAPSDDEFEVAYRSGTRHALRLRRVQPTQLPKRTSSAVRADGSVAPYRLEIDRPGVLANLALHATQRRVPGPDEVEVRVRAGGINFRDVMKALGTHPGRPPDLRWLGDDLAGVVERVGNAVRDLRPGDEVVGIAPYAFGAYAVTRAPLLFKKPPRISFAQAATIPTAFLTAYHAIVDVARMRRGERLLIHAAAGGVGQAAVQVARHLGLEIFATAGSPEKRRLLHDMGVRHVMSSRTLEFADQIMELTSGRGVDAVLNSLAGDFIAKGLSVLAPFGRFLEIGKVDIYRNTKIGLEQLRNNISYSVIDLTQHLRDRRDLVARMLAEIEARFEAGDYQPLPYTAFPITKAAEAFRFMAQARHVGKNVLDFDIDPIPVAFAAEDGRRFRGDASYLITGGAGGVGLEIGKWLARHGARRLVLMSRSGPPDDAARRDLAELRAAGVTVVDARGDVTRPEDVRRVVEEARAAGRPLKGVIHGAMVLDDEWLTALDPERFQRVLEPKMAGAWNLHVATRDCELEHFVCLSSFSAVCGAPRQSNYNAGNLFLGALAQYRHARGMPALTVDWGVIRGAGYIERNVKTAEYLDKFDFTPFRVDDALRVLGALVPLDTAEIVAAGVNWRALARLSPLVGSSRTYAALTSEHRGADATGSLSARLRASAGEDRAALVEDFVAAQVAEVFGIMPDKLDRTAPLTTLGLDSLMTVELVNRVDREVGVRLPVGQLLGGPSIQGVAQVVLQLLATATAEDGALSSASAVPDAAAGPTSPASTSAAWHVVPIRTGGGEPPLIAFHGVGGGVGIYTVLARHLSSDVPVYGIESRFMRGAEREFSRLDEMVDAYAAIVRELTPSPYRLAGFSFGGYLAGRVAERLEAQGETVELVAAVDWNARPARSAQEQQDTLRRLAIATYGFMETEVGAVRSVPEGQLAAELGPLVERVICERPARSDLFFQWAVERGLMVSEHVHDWARRYLACFVEHCTMLADEIPRPRFRAPLIVWRARDGLGSPIESWEHTGVGVEHVLDGDHFAFLRPPGVLTLAKHLDDVLRQLPASAG